MMGKYVFSIVLGGDERCWQEQGQEFQQYLLEPARGMQREEVDRADLQEQPGSHHIGNRRAQDVAASESIKN